MASSTVVAVADAEARDTGAVAGLGVDAAASVDVEVRGVERIVGLVRRSRKASSMSQRDSMFVALHPCPRRWVFLDDLGSALIR